MKLRPYQNDCVSALWSALVDGESAPVAVLPTGAGKSLVIAALLQKAMEANATALVLTHRQELLVQNRSKLAELMGRPEHSFGLYCAALGSKTYKQITFASIQSFVKIDRLQSQNLLIIDEAHLVSSKESTTYCKLIERLRALNPKLKIVGVTATPFRMGQGLITDGKNAIFSKIVYNACISDLIRQGYLSPLVSKRTTKAEIDTRGIQLVNGDFSKSALSPRITSILQDVIPQVIEAGKTRKSWLIFTPSIEIAEAVTRAMQQAKVKAELLVGSASKGERQSVLERFKSGRIQAIVSVDVITTGFDAPNTDMIVLLRPTKSTGLYIQMVGRGARLAPGKQNCLVLDFGGNIERFGPIDQIEVTRKKDSKKRQAPMKFCPVCGMHNNIGARQCADEIVCGYQWPIPTRGEKLLQKYSSDAKILSEPEQWHVRASVSMHHKVDGLPTVKISYVNDRGKEANKFLGFQHDGWFKRQACKWWVVHMQGKCPEDCATALAKIEAEWVPPTTIIVTKKGQYYDILEEVYNANQREITT